MNDNPTILLVDDSENDLMLMRAAFERAGYQCELQTARDGEQAIAYLEGAGQYSDRTKFPLPQLVLLDLNMPRKTGFDVLAWARSQPQFRNIPIIILTASVRAEDVERTFELGAHSFLVKPTAIAELTAMLRCLREWLGYNHFPPRNPMIWQ
jgi:CheY-like chemotaxis protein